MADVKELIKQKFGEDNIERIELIRGEVEQNKLIETEYPRSLKRKFIIVENFGLSIEEFYFWIKDAMAEFGFIDTEKLIDTFTASEQSAMFGSAQQRLGIQQDKASQYLATIGKMVKELFQIVRDIQLLDERERLYVAAAKGDDGAEKALKGIWIDFVDNGPGQLKASSVYGLASQIGYTILPDLFFAAPANLKQENISKHVKSLDFNDKVKTVLVRKLEQFTAWRDATAKQITSKKKFTIQYLRQHYNSIKLYMDWIKPYLRNIKRLSMDAETQLSANIVGAFEGAVLQLEVLGKKPGNPHACILASFVYRTRPVMQTGQDYQRGPQHLGRMEMTLRGYVWTDEEIQKFRELKLQEDFEMLKSIDESVEQAMEHLGDDLKKYLIESGEKFGEENKVEQLAKSIQKAKPALTIDEAREQAKKLIKKEEKRPSAFEPFTSIWGGFADIGKGFIATKSEARDAKKKAEDIKEKKDGLKGLVLAAVSTIYKNFKKSRKLIVP
jgi:hypothetical protein